MYFAAQRREDGCYAPCAHQHTTPDDARGCLSEERPLLVRGHVLGFPVDGRTTGIMTSIFDETSRRWVRPETRRRPAARGTP